MQLAPEAETPSGRSHSDSRVGEQPLLHITSVSAMCSAVTAKGKGKRYATHGLYCLGLTVPGAPSLAGELT